MGLSNVHDTYLTKVRIFVTATDNPIIGTERLQFFATCPAPTPFELLILQAFMECSILIQKHSFHRTIFGQSLVR